MKVGNGCCWNCPHYNGFSEYCDIYHIVTKGQGFEPNCYYEEEYESEMPKKP